MYLGKKKIKINILNFVYLNWDEEINAENIIMV